MAKRTNMQKQYPSNVEPIEIESNSELLETRSVEIEKPAIVIQEVPKYNKGINNTILIRSRIDAIYKTTGSVSGRIYVFNGGGSIIDVNKEDADELLSRHKGGRGCCGGSDTQNYIFELV